MRLSLLCFTFLATFQSYACTEAMKPFVAECKIQDRYNHLGEEFSKNKIKITNVKGFAIPRVIGNLNYQSLKNDFLNHPESSLKQNKDWQAWKNGQKFLENFNPVFVEYSDILKLHKTTFSGSAEAGKIRSNIGETNPKIHYSCKDQKITEEISALLENYDVKSSEGYPLLTLENVTHCEDNKNFSADLIFYKGASMKTELKNWLNEFNDTLSRYSSDQHEIDLAPYAFLSDIKRSFLAIHPFTSGNELVINLLMDFAAKKLALPPPAMANSNVLFMDIYSNRTETLKTTQESLNFLENCLFETKVNLVSPYCSSI